MESADKKENEGSGAKDAFNAAFQAFSVFGQKISDGLSITLENIIKWFKEAGIFDSGKVTEEDTAAAFSKVAKSDDKIYLGDFDAFLDELVSDTGLTREELMAKLTEASKPELPDKDGMFSGLKNVLGGK